LEYVFGTYGTVEKVHVMRGKVKNGCISGFVEFEKPDEATTAIMSLDNKSKSVLVMGLCRCDLPTPRGNTSRASYGRTLDDLEISKDD